MDPPMIGDDASKILHLSGFSDLDDSEKREVNRVFDHHLKKFEMHVKKIESFELHLKTVHAREKSEKYEIKAVLLAPGKRYASSFTDRNLITCLHEVMEKIEHELGSK